MSETVRLEHYGAPGSDAFSAGPFGSTVSSKNFVAEGLPMLRGSNLSIDVGIRLDESDLVHLPVDYANRYPRSVVREGDLIFTCWGTIGQIGIVARGTYDEYLISNKQMKMTPDPSRIHPLFLYYYLSQPNMISLVQSSAIGSSVPGFNLGQLKALPVLIPDLTTQTAIAGVLGALDDKIEANRKLAATADELAHLQYTASVSKLEQRRMSEVLEPRLGATPKRSNDDYWGGSGPWVSVKDVSMAVSGVILETDENISDLAIAETRARPLPAGSVVLTARGTVGKVARLAVAASFNQSCYAFVPGDISPALVYFAVRDAASALMGHVHGSVFDTITTRTFDQVTVPELRDVAPSQVARISKLLDVVESAVRQTRQLATLRDTLLPKLMSGQLRVEETAELVS